MTQGNELELWQRAYEELAPEVRERWALEQVKTIRNTVARDLSPAEFQMGLAIAARYDLDPLLHEIWFAKGRGRDGQPGRVLIMVGRDGLLRNARRDKDYRGFDCDVVHENDVFRVVRTADGQRSIHHEYEGSAAKRGEIVGAWAQVFVEGRGTTYFFAPMEEYMPKTDKQSPWKTQPSVMIQKAALSLCLRLAFNLSGVVGEDEGAIALSEPEYGPEPGWDAAEHVPSELLERYTAAVQATRGNPRFSPAAVQMNVSGQSPERVLAYIEEMEAAAGDATDDDATDADVVADDYDADLEAETAAMDDENLGGGGYGPVAAEAPAPPAASSSHPDGEPSAQPTSAEEDGPAVAAQDQAVLRRRLASLEEAVLQAGITEEQVADIEAEIDAVEAELRTLAAHAEGQGSLL